MRRIYLLLDRAGYELRHVESRRTVNGWHLWLTLEPAPRTPFEVIALQAILGSDPLRESVNLLRARKLWRTPEFAREWWNVLYKPGEFSRFQISLFQGDSTNGGKQVDSNR